MDDSYLHQIRRDPPPEFQRALRERLRQQTEPRRRLAPVLVPAFATTAAVVLAVALFTIPSVRASAQALLDIFRVRTFAAVEYDESRLEKLKSLKQDNALLVFDRHEVVRDPGPGRRYATVTEAGAAAGLEVRTPGYLPNGLALDSVMVEGAGEGRLAVSEHKLRTLLDQLELRDVQVPAGIEGQWVEVRKPAAVIQAFSAGSGRARAGLVQATSPEVSLPLGIDLEQLAEVGLRVLGLDPGEARRIARATDWRSTLMVPVPMNASTFRQVTIHGNRGLLVTLASAPSADGDRRREGTVVLWTEGERVFGLRTNLGPEDAVQIADSVR
jgi:hypothetical protein